MVRKTFYSIQDAHSEIDRLKTRQTRQCLLNFRPDLIPEELARSNQWVVWSYEVSKQYENLFRINKQPYQPKFPRNKVARIDASDWSNLEDALWCWEVNDHIDGIGYIFAKGDGLIGIDLDNCRNPYTGKIKKEYLYWIKKINSYAEVSPSGTGVKIWVKGVVPEDYFFSTDSTGFRIRNYASGEIEIYRNGQFFTVTTQIINGFDSIRKAQTEIDVICAFSLSHTEWDFISSCDSDNIDLDELENLELSLLQSYWDDENLAFNNEISADKSPFIEEESECFDSRTSQTQQFCSGCFNPRTSLIQQFCEEREIETFADFARTFIEEESECFDSRTSQIQQFCEEREIETLVHFTRIENLGSILQQGLVGRSILQTRKQQFLWNDENRADKCPQAICLSISFPNYQMFYSIREQKKPEGINDSKWVVVLLDAKVLWELDCAFCQRNAASNAVSSIPLDERRNPEALKGMFEDFYNIKHQDLQIPQNHPTHPQAEVLVFNTIPVQYINAIHFCDATIMEQMRSNYTETFSDKFFCDKKLFKPRSDYEVWRPEKFNADGIPLSYFSDGNDEEPDDFVDYIPF